MADKKNTLEAEVNRRTGNPITSRIWGSEIGGSEGISNAARRATLDDLDYAQRRNEWNQATRNYNRGGMVKGGSYSVPQMCKGGKVIKSWSK